LKRAIVAILKTTPQKVSGDIFRLMEMAGAKEALKAGTTTILKDNISWHFPFLSANTTPWQLEGTIRALKEAGFPDLVAVHKEARKLELKSAISLAEVPFHPGAIKYYRERGVWK